MVNLTWFGPLSVDKHKKEAWVWELKASMNDFIIQMCAGSKLHVRRIVTAFDNNNVLVQVVCADMRVQW